MFGVILFDNHDDLLYVYSDEEFKNKIETVAKDLNICRNQQEDNLSEAEAETISQKSSMLKNGVEALAVMQMFSPLLTSHRIMNEEFQNTFHNISCEDGSTLAFYEHMHFLAIAVSRSKVNAVHLVRASFDIMLHVCGPSLSMLKHSETHTELVTLLIDTFLNLRETSLSIITESLHYEPISEELNAGILNVLQEAVDELKNLAGIPESRAHILVIKDTSIVALFSGRDTLELKIEEVLFLVIVANAFAHSSSSTRNSLVILEYCVPYSIHIQRIENGLTIIILIEVGLQKLGRALHSLLTTLTSVSSNGYKPDVISKQLTEVRKLATSHNMQWSETLLGWRSGSKENQSAVSALARQIFYGFELMCLDTALLFGAVEHVSTVIDKIKFSIPVRVLSLPCQFTSLLQIYPGLVHFVLIDRNNHRMISPSLPLDRKDSTFENMWQMFHTSLEWLNEGHYHLLWNDKQLCYSHSIWCEDATNKKLSWKSTWSTQTGVLGYPALLGMGNQFYKKLLKEGIEDEESEPVHYLQLFCIHLGLTSPNLVLEQAGRMANHLKRFLYPSMSRLEDLF